MFKGKKVAVIIAAGGSGSRMGTDIPKQFLPLGGQTILEKTVSVFENNEYVDGICVITAKDYLQKTG